MTGRLWGSWEEAEADEGKRHPIDSRPRAIPQGQIQALWPPDDIKAEPQFWSADHEYAWQLGGPITQAWLASIAATLDPFRLDDSGVVIDTRVHMLMPSWWPCIPGWHHDDVPRERSDGQPLYEGASYRPHHYATFVATSPGLCRTEYASGSIEMPEVPYGRKYYREWEPLVAEAIANGWLEVAEAHEGQLWGFDDRGWHQGTQATAFGWRWFGRLSLDSGRPIVNEIRHQTQVYIADPTEGW